MTSKLSWIAFVPFMLAALAIKGIQLFFMNADGTFLGLTELQLSYIAIGCMLATFLFALIFCLIDRKTAPVYMINRNIFAGIFGLLMSVMLACDGANSAFNMIRTANFTFLEIADIVLTVFCAIVFVVMGLNHFVGNGGVRGMALFYLVPTLWSALRLVSCFLQFTTVSITVTDVTILSCYIFATLFLFNYAMIVSLMKGKNPVKSAFVFGLPAVVSLISYGIYETVKALFKNGNFKFFNNLETFEIVSLGLYIFVFLIEMSRNALTKDEIKYVDGETEEEYVDVVDADSDIIDALQSSIKYGNSPDKPVSVNTDLCEEEHLSADDQLLIDVVQASMNETSEDDTSGFIYGSMPSDEDFVTPTGLVENDEIEITDNVDDYITKDVITFEESDEKDTSNMESQLDRIDRLILEIEEDEKK